MHSRPVYLFPLLLLLLHICESNLFISFCFLLNLMYDCFHSMSRLYFTTAKQKFPLPSLLFHILPCTLPAYLYIFYFTYTGPDIAFIKPTLITVTIVIIISKTATIFMSLSCKLLPLSALK